MQFICFSYLKMLFLEGISWGSRFQILQNSNVIWCWCCCCCLVGEFCGFVRLFGFLSFFVFIWFGFSVFLFVCFTNSTLPASPTRGAAAAEGLMLLHQ